MRPFFLLSLLGAASLSVSLPTNNGCSLTTVHTTSGNLIGHPAKDRTEVTEWLGIRYAKADRFMPPQQYLSNATVEASRYSPECPCAGGKNGDIPGQPFTATEPRIMGYFLETFKNVTMSDDCLAVNVWSKRNSSKQLKPVLLWAYGGHWQTGVTNTPFYQGQYLASQEDIVVVTFNYRFSIFGFGKDNLGIQDGRAALEWTRNNIEKFGGDPGAITFAGHSAGAFLADTLAFAHPDDPIAAAYILQSGSATTLPATDPALRDSGFKNVSIAVGCANATNEIACLQKVDLQDLARAAMIPQPPSGSLKTVFGPTIDNKTVFSPVEYVRRGQNGEFPQSPTLLGNANYEQGFYKLQYSALGKFNTEAFWTSAVQRLAVCPAAQGADWRYHRTPTWRYRYFGEYPSLKLYPASANGSLPGSSAYHGSELSLVWGTAEPLTLETPDAELASMSGYMMQSWGAFIRDPEHGLEKRGWPRYDPKSSTLVKLAQPGGKQVEFGNSTQYDFLYGRDCTAVMLNNR